MRKPADHSKSLALTVAIGLVASACSQGGSDAVGLVTTDSSIAPSTTSASTTSTTSTASTTEIAVVAEENRAAFSCEPTEDLRTITHEWEVGETRSLSLVIDRTREGTSGSSTTPATITVEGVDADGTLFEWSNGLTDLSSLGLSDDAAEELAPLLQNSPLSKLRYRTDEYGYFAGVEDPDEFRRSVLEMSEMLSDVTPDLDFEEVRSAYESASDESLSQVFTKTQQLFHAFDGSELLPGQEVTAPDLLPNAFGGPAIPAFTSIIIGFEPDAEGCLAVTMLTEIDSEQFIEVILPSAATFFGIDPDEATPEDLAEIRAKADTTIEVVARIDPTTGRTKSISSTRTFGDPEEDGMREIREIVDITPVP